MCSLLLWLCVLSLQYLFFETVPVVVGFVGGIAVDVLFAQKVSVVLGLRLLPE